MAAGEIEKVTITIVTRNAPFCDEHAADPERNRPDWTVNAEVARILRDIADRADLLGAETRSVRDDFGHEVGTITIEREA